MKHRTLSCDYGCPVEAAMQVIGGKWKSLILYHLHCNSIMRFNALQKAIQSINQRMLANQLRELEADKLVHRKVYPVVPPKVEYSLTELSKPLGEILLNLRDWGEYYTNALDKT
ncbi:winged helix-turn-helix transcriptional regulator [Cysteiniphilum halobium]|uniref:winged helix-turn-helix transcriptional regulator n=1 Tax=Cysteiniphilum halobium TaxID=2219059 RepID=UPI003F866D33